MRFEPIVEDDPFTGLTHRLRSETGLVTLGIYRVLYGYRVRGGFTANKLCVELDWCAAILSTVPEDEDCFDGLATTSSSKPVWNDAEFMAWLQARLATTSKSGSP